MRRLLAPFIVSALALPAAAEPAVWTCRIERVIEAGTSTLLTGAARAAPSGRFTFTADTSAGAGCLHAPSGPACVIAYTGAIEGGGVLRLAATDASGVLDLVNIFTATGRFIRIHGSTQWMGEQGDCVKRG